LALQKRADALLIVADPLFASRPVQLATLAARHALPAIYSLREFAEAGGLMSYGSNFTELFRQVEFSRARSRPTCRSCNRSSSSLSSICRPPRRSAFEVPATLLAIANEVIE
jgi:putative ABC transport system substrate-binding protein